MTDARPQPEAALTPGIFAWLAVIPFTGLLVAAALLLAPPLGRAIYPSPSETFFDVPFILPLIKPEPVEMIRFLLAIAAPAVLAGTILATRGRWPWRWPRHRAAHLAAIGLQAAGVAFLIVCGVAQRNAPSEGVVPPALFSLADAIGASIVAAVLMGAVLRGRLAGFLSASTGWATSARWRLLTLGAAAAVTGLWLLPALFRDSNVGDSINGVYLHLPVAYDEILAVANGRTPLVDFIPQYTSLLPYAVAPATSALGSSITAFTVVMTLMSLAALLAVYAVLVRVTDHPVAALALYVPFVAISLFPLAEAGSQRLTMANLYQVFPMRYLGPFGVAWLCARHLQGAAPRRPLALFAVAGLVAINNPEFGMPCFGATLVGLWCGSDGGAVGAAERARSRARRWAGSLLGQAIAGLALAAALVAAMTLVRASALPDPAKFSYFSRTFAIEGFGMEPMPTLGFHLVMYVTFAAALATAAVRKVTAAPGAVLTGMLAYSAVFGLGAGVYYAGRSLPFVLVALFAAWGFTVVLLTWTVLTALGGHPELSRPARMRLLVPGAALFACFGLMVSSVAQLPAPWTQVKRFATTGEGELLSRPQSARFIARTTAPGEPVAILEILGHGLAERSGVADLSPWNHPGSVLRAEQMDLLLRGLEEGGGRKVFASADVYPQIREHLRRSAYVPLTRDPGSGMTVWEPKAGAGP